MNAREYLEQYLRKTEQIEALQDKIAEIRACAEKCTSVLSPTPGGNAHNDSRLEQLVVKIDSMEQQLGILWEERGRIYIEIVTLLCEIPTDACRRLLELRYLEGKTYDEIAEEILMGNTYIYRTLRQGIQETEAILEKRTKKVAKDQRDSKKIAER